MKTKLNLVKKSIVILFFTALGTFACNKSDNPIPPPPPPPHSTLTILKFDTVNVGSTSAKFVWKDSSNQTITSRTLTNNNTSEVTDVFSLSTYESKSLTPNTQYSFTFKVKDVSGKIVSAPLSFYTREKVSTIIAFGEISYDHQFTIVGNAQSDTLRIKIKNLSSKSKVLPSLSANFGANSRAVKMLRYRFSDTSKWIILQAQNGLVTFQNLLLAPGENEFKAIFSIKPYPGVADNAPITFAFKTMDDGEGGSAPSGGWPAEIPVGNVDAHTAPTTLQLGWMSYSFSGALSISPGFSGTFGINSVINLKLSGPAPARVVSLKLKNPYAEFIGMEWGYPDPNNDFHQWIFNKDFVSCYEEVANFYWQKDFINLTFEGGCNTLNVDGSLQDFDIDCGAKNHSNLVFNANDYTPGLTGFILVSKFDFVLENSSMQVIDVSDANVVQDGAPLNN